jgi:negative regulator of flagellin synthesis FlgM
MVAEVKGPGPGVVTALQTPAARSEKAPDVGPDKSGTAIEAGIQITDLGARLHALIQTVAEVPQVDQARVDVLRQALADGSYQVDPNAVADKLLAFEGMLGNGKQS